MSAQNNPTGQRVNPPGSECVAPGAAPPFFVLKENDWFRRRMEPYGRPWTWDDMPLGAYIHASALQALAERWRAEAERCRASAGRAQKRGDDSTADVNFAFAQNVESHADEIAALLAASQWVRP